MDLKLNNKYALVCGSTAGIGKATALALAEEGANITLVARNEGGLLAAETSTGRAQSRPGREEEALHFMLFVFTSTHCIV